MASPFVAGNSCRPTMNLPPEIWVKVLSHLPVDDRKNFRLTCRQFDDLADDVLLQRSEETVFHGNLNTVAAIRILSNCERKAWNLKFVGVSFADESFVEVSSFFARKGARVRSLVFDDCKIGSKLLKDIMFKCKYLLSFAVLVGHDKRSTRWEEIYEGMAAVYDTFIALHAAGFVHQNVKEFTLRVWIRRDEYRPLTDDNFLSFFAVFPNIEKLDFRYRIRVLLDTTYPRIADTNFSLSCAYYQLFKMRHQLSTLSLDLCYSDTVGYDNPVKVRTLNDIFGIEMTNLKRRSLFWGDFWDDSFTNYFLQLKHLTELDITIGERIHIYGAGLIQLVLESATELRAFHLSGDNSRSYIVDIPLKLTKNCFQTLVRSQLRSFTVSMDLRIDFHFTSLDLSLRPNRVLKNLDVKIDLASKSSSFFKYFHCVEKLLIRNLEHGILPNIFDHQKELRYLIFDPYKTIDLNGNSKIQQWLTAQDQLNYQLRVSYLTHLCFDEGGKDKSFLLSFSEFILSKFEFPQLRSLAIISRSPFQYTTQFNVDLFFIPIQKLAKLEYLEMKLGIEMSCQQLLYLCGTLSNLRYLICLDSYFKPFEEYEYRQFFQVCPLLRALIHRKSSTNCVKYFKDPATNTLINITLPRNSSREFIWDGIPQKYFIPVDYSLF